MPKRILIDRRFCQLGNILYRFCNVVAFSMDHHITVWDSSLHVSGYSSLFPNVGKRLWLSYPRSLMSPFGMRLFHGLQSRVIRFAAFRAPFVIHDNSGMESEITMDLETIFPEVGKDTAVIRGFHFEANQAVERHADYFRWLFKPKEAVVSRARRGFLDLADKADKVVAVHIRQGDFKKWNKGRFFFDTTYYSTVMERIRVLCSGESVRFVIFSDNENLDTRAFNGLDFFFSRESRSLSYDWYFMSLCDFIVAPLYSTYSGWASFYGRTPIFRLNGKAMPRSMADFIFRPVLNNSRQYNRSLEAAE